MKYWPRVAALIALLAVAGGVWYSLIWFDKGSAARPLAVAGAGKPGGGDNVLAGDSAAKRARTARARGRSGRLADPPDSGPELAAFGTTAALATREIYVPEDDYEYGEVLVANPPERFEATVGDLGFAVAEKVTLPRLAMVVYRVRIPANTSVAGARRILRSNFPGLVVDANHHYQPQAGPEFPDKVARAVIGWKRAAPTCGAGVRLGMIDGAVDVTHPALAGRKLRFRSFHRAGRGPGPKEHGTAVAAMLVGRSEWGGLLPGAELRAGNMFEQKKTGQVVGSAIGLLKSIDWLIAERVHAVNLSVAGSDNKIVRRAFEKGARGGLILVAAAGNWGRKGNKPAFPAAYRQVIAVTAFVNKKLVYSSANTGRYIEFAAPGVKIWTAVPGGGRFLTGTSMAAPFVTALMGLANARGRFKNAKALRKAMRARVEDLGRRGRDEVFGFGFITLKPPC